MFILLWEMPTRRKRPERSQPDVLFSRMGPAAQPRNESGHSATGNQGEPKVFFENLLL
jgi:hypothetical protein